MIDVYNCYTYIITSILNDPVLVQFFLQPEILTDESHQCVLAVGEPPAVVKQPQDEHYNQQQEGRCQGADDDECHVRHFSVFEFGYKSSGKDWKAFPTA